MLQTYRLEHIIGYGSNEWIYDSLSQLAPSVEVIEFKISILHLSRDPTGRFVLPSYTMSTEPDWHRIRLILEDLPSLRHLRICRESSETNLYETQVMISSQLSEYHSRGILSFHPF